MTSIERLRAHPKVRDVVASDDELTVRLVNGDEVTMFGGLETAAAEVLADLDGDDA